MNNQWYINYVNTNTDRKKCPVCGQMIFATEDKDGMVYIDLKHSYGCKFLNEYQRACDDGVNYEKDNNI